HQYLRRYGVAVGRRPVFFLNSDEAYEAVFALSGAGIECVVIDVRDSSLAAERARALGVEVHGGAVVEGAYGRDGVRTVRVVDVTGRARRELAADCLLMSGGHSPATTLASQLGARLTWQEAIAAFTADLAPVIEHMKRFTTHGMATDQGRIGGLVGSAVLAQARGVPLWQVGQTRPRPFAQPVPFAALAGGEVREHYRPKRRLPLHDWHEAAGATF